MLSFMTFYGLETYVECTNIKLVQMRRALGPCGTNVIHGKVSYQKKLTDMLLKAEFKACFLSSSKMRNDSTPFWLFVDCIL